MNNLSFTCNEIEYLYKGDLTLESGNENIPLYEDLENGTFFYDGDSIRFLGLEIMHFFGRFSLPRIHWGDVITVFKDGNRSNFEPSNLFPWYKKPIKCDLFDGFYYVPGMELNVVNENGVVIQLQKDRLRKPWTGKTGKDNSNLYPFTRCDVVDRDNRISTHRLIGLTFCNPPKDYPNMWVDHSNGNKQDFRKVNLNWMYPKDNTLKGVYVDGNNKQIVQVEVLDTKTGKVDKYPSLSALANFFGVNQMNVSNAFNSHNQTYKKRYVIRECGDERTWKEIGESEALEINGFESKNIFTGEVLEWRNIGHFLAVNGGGRAAIKKALINRTSSIIAGVIFRFKGEGWNEPSEMEKTIYNKGLQPSTKVYRVEDELQNTVTVCYGTSELKELIPLIDKRTIIMVYKSGRLYKNRYKIEVMN